MIHGMTTEEALQPRNGKAPPWCESETTPATAGGAIFPGQPGATRHGECLCPRLQHLFLWIDGVRHPFWHMCFALRAATVARFAHRHLRDPRCSTRAHAHGGALATGRYRDVSRSATVMICREGYSQGTPAELPRKQQLPQGQGQSGKRAGWLRYGHRYPQRLQILAPQACAQQDCSKTPDLQPLRGLLCLGKLRKCRAAGRIHFPGAASNSLRLQR